jgi:hypothetical protein
LFDSFVNIGGFVVRTKYLLTWAEVPEKKAAPVKAVPSKDLFVKAVFEMHLTL